MDALAVGQTAEAIATSERGKMRRAFYRQRKLRMFVVSAAFKAPSHALYGVMPD
jgi:hypothetical protein